MARSNPGRRPYEWSDFELQAVLALICKLEHFNGPLEFATKLNEALSKTENSRDIPLRDVKDLLAHIEQNKKGALAFIERQPRPHVVTRTKRMAFQRDLNFDGSMLEWLTGRRDAVAAKKSAAAVDARREMSPGNGQGGTTEDWRPENQQFPGGEIRGQFPSFGKQTPLRSTDESIGAPEQSIRDSSPPYLPPPPPIMSSGAWRHNTYTTPGWASSRTSTEVPAGVDLSRTPIPSGGWGSGSAAFTASHRHTTATSNNDPYQALRPTNLTAVEPRYAKPRPQVYSEGRPHQSSSYDDDKSEKLPPEASVQ